ADVRAEEAHLAVADDECVRQRGMPSDSDVISPSSHPILPRRRWQRRAEPVRPTGGDAVGATEAWGLVASTAPFRPSGAMFDLPPGRSNSHNTRVGDRP